MFGFLFTISVFEPLRSVDSGDFGILMHHHIGSAADSLTRYSLIPSPSVRRMINEPFDFARAREKHHACPRSCPRPLPHMHLACSRLRQSEA